MNLKIEYLDKNQLKPYANNAKVHTADQVEQIKKSIAEFGFNDPIAIWHDNEIIEGHGRLLAAMEMNEIETVPVIRLDDLSDEQRKAYAIAHNKLTMNTDFDLDLLSLELESIESLDMTDFGFNEAEILELTIDDSPEAIPTATEVMQQQGAGSAQASNVPPALIPPYMVADGQNPQDVPQAQGSSQLTKEDIDYYAQRAEQTVTRRVIIVYSSEEEEAYLKALLSQDEEKPLGVVFDIKNIMKAHAQKQEQTNESEEEITS